MRIVSVVGARPNFVKIAPLIREMRSREGLVSILVHTGQHYDPVMSGQFFEALDIPAPDFNLDVGSGSHASQTGEVMKRLDPVLASTAPDLLLVVGDVNSTLAAALTASKLGIPIAHVEAGLRSFDRTMPEEINRVLTDAISDLLFVTEETARENLVREGIDARKIHFVGNVMIDALETSRHRWERSSVFESLALAPGDPYAVLTLHRPSNVDDTSRLTTLVEALQELARDLPIVFAMHPRSKQQLVRHGHLDAAALGSDRPVRHKGLIYIDPLGYLDFVALLSRARLVLTDSGGIQEETTVLNVPCLTLRTSTERPITVTHGTNRVIGTDAHRIVEEARRTLERPPRRVDPPPLWDGRAAQRIVQILADSPAARLQRVDSRAIESCAPAATWVPSTAAARAIGAEKP